jgi:hypothetical protein
VNKSQADGFLTALILFSVLGLLGGLGYGLINQESWQVVVGRGLIGAVAGAGVTIWLDIIKGF